MGRRLVRRYLALAAVGASALLAIAAPAGGASRFHFPSHVTTTLPRRVDVSFFTPSSDGYGLRFEGFHSFRVEHPTKREEEQMGRSENRSVSFAEVTVGKGPGSVAYEPIATVGGDGTVDVPLGARGRIVGHFVAASREPGPAIPGCATHPVIETGTLRGRIEFRGEGGFTTLDRAAVPATFSTAAEATCTFKVPRPSFPGPPQHPGRPPKVTLGGQLTQEGTQVSFAAETHQRLGTVTFLAFLSERLPHLSITRTEKATASLRSLPYDLDAGTGRVEPPAPFTGDASFEAFAGKESGTWLGPLAVDFLGRPGVRLAGRRFKGDLLKGNECLGDPSSSCFETRFPDPINLGPRQPVG